MTFIHGFGMTEHRANSLVANAAVTTGVSTHGYKSSLFIFQAGHGGDGTSSPAVHLALGAVANLSTTTALAAGAYRGTLFIFTTTGASDLTWQLQDSANGTTGWANVAGVTQALGASEIKSKYILHADVRAHLRWKASSAGGLTVCQILSSQDSFGTGDLTWQLQDSADGSTWASMAGAVVTIGNSEMQTAFVDHGDVRDHIRWLASTVAGDTTCGVLCVQDAAGNTNYPIEPSAVAIPNVVVAGHGIELTP